MSLSEKYAGELQDNLPLRRHFIRVWYGLAADVERGAGGWVATGATALPVIGDVYPYGTWSGLITPRCARVDVDPRHQVGEIQVVAHYYGPLIESEITDATGSTYLELSCLRRHREFLKKDGKWRGQRVYEVPTGSLSALLPSLRKLAWTVNTIKMTPRHVGVLQQDPECPGFGRVTLEYAFGDNPAAYGRLNADGINVPTLGITGWGDNERLMYGQKDGKDDLSAPIETVPQADGTYFKLVRGSNVRPRPEAQYILRTAMPRNKVAVDWARGYKGIGRVNEFPFGVKAAGKEVELAAIGELMLLRMEIPEFYIWDADDLNIPVRYVFHFKKGGFADCHAQRFQKAAVVEYVYHATDDPVKWYGTTPPTKAVARTYLSDDGAGTAVDATNKAALNWGGVQYGAWSAPVTDAKASLSIKTRTVVRERPLSKSVARVLSEPYDFRWLMQFVEW